jgi:hypothetical protein
MTTDKTTNSGVPTPQERSGSEEKLEKVCRNLTDQDLDSLLKDMMRAKGFKTFVNYCGEEEDL